MTARRRIEFRDARHARQFIDRLAARNRERTQLARLYHRINATAADIPAFDPTGYTGVILGPCCQDWAASPPARSQRAATRPGLRRVTVPIMAYTGSRAWVTTVGSPGPRGSKSVQRTETSRELMDDAVALVGKWNAEHRAAEETRGTGAPTARGCRSARRTSARRSSLGSRGCACCARPVSSKAGSICARWCGMPTIPSLACTMRSHAHSAPAVATVRAR